MDFIEPDLTLNKEDFDGHINERLLTIYHEKYFLLPFYSIVCTSSHNHMITLCSASYLSQSEHVVEQPRNKNVEK